VTGRALARVRTPCKDPPWGMGTGRHASRRALATAAAIALAIGLAGCGSSDKPDPTGPAASLESKIDIAQAKAKAAPTDPKPLAELATLHFQAAGLKTGSTGKYSDAGKDELREATQAWERYVALDPSPLDTGVAQLMAAAYGPGSLEQPKKAVAVQQVLAERTRPPDPALYAQLAQKAYYAGDTQTAERAARRAVELTPKSRRAAMRETLKTARSQAAPAQP
jgi:Flp pilus assembly protein TadD